MDGVLAVAEFGYERARYHYALMLNDPLSRGWCCFEVMVRILAGMLALGIERAEDIVPFLLRRDPRFTRLVIVPGLTDIFEDVTGQLFDRYGEMKTFAAADRVMIQRRIVEACGSSVAFNLLLGYCRAAAIQHQVRWACSTTSLSTPTPCTGMRLQRGAGPSSIRASVPVPVDSVDSHPRACRAGAARQPF